MQKVLLINGSPNVAGCTFTALSEVAKALHEDGLETEIFHIGTKPVHGCVACGKCWEIQRCVQDGDPANAILHKMRAADGVVVGSPVYYAGPNGALCALLDRVFFANGGTFHGKPAACVVSCRRSGASAAYDRLNKYFSINRMPIVTSQYWNNVHGNEPEEVMKDLEGLQTMRTLGHQMAWMIDALLGKALPAAEDRVATNFIR